uniref:E3 ubiquitin-protein ligase HERC2-like isoform X2 n=1 Tax=Macaca mulatta TaxID=9544 RepID=UPI0010A22F9B|nr:E3 ubiquitin-protein ligase HERC2-like isoform X2 [Macaca mulatta]
MDHKGSLQEVIGWGLTGWKYYANVIGPIQCEGLANVGVTQIACAEKRFLILSHNGHVHTQAYNSDTLAPQLVQGLASRNIVKIAAHSDGHHCVALAATGEVYSWALGTADGWAMGTLWQVWSWGDGDCGKLGRGGSDGCKTPKLIEKLQDLDVVRVRCGSQFSIALTKDGQVYSWGKGDNQRLGHGPEGHVPYPKLLEGLRGKKVIDAAAGSTHCLALTEDSEVHSSGSKDQCQHFDTLRVTKPEPAALPGLDTKHTVGIACGPAQFQAMT